MQEDGLARRDVEAALLAAREADFSLAGGTVLGSMCTAPHPVAAWAHARFLETNLGDPLHFPGTANLEAEVLADIAAMLSAPDGAAGRYLTGGTEANLLALYVAREATGRRRVVLPESAHFSFDKAARLLGMALDWVPTDAGGRADPDAMAAAIGPDTALVVAVAGTTELGLVDPIEDIAARCVATGVRLHVDAAFGGYVLPFLAAAGRAPVAFDFAVPGVTSIAVDPHKMGMSTIPGGVLVLAAGADWTRLAVDTPYVSTQTQASLMGTRPGAAVAACWAVHRHLGRVGFAANARRALDDAAWLADALVERGFELVAPPDLNVVTFHADDPQGLSDALEAAGLRVNIVPRFGAIRIVVMPHVTHAVLERFLAVLDQVVVAS